MYHGKAECREYSISDENKLKIRSYAHNVSPKLNIPEPIKCRPDLNGFRAVERNSRPGTDPKQRKVPLTRQLTLHRN